jgi:hypothetical protein
MVAVARERFDGGDGVSFELADPDQTASDRIAVDVDGAGAAIAGAAAILVPVRLDASRSAQRSGVSGSMRYWTGWPLTVKRIGED